MGWRVVGRLATGLENLHEPPAVAGGGLDGRDQVVCGHVVRAGTRDQQAVAFHEPQRQLIELAISGLSLRDILLALDEGRWVDNHHIKALRALLQCSQRVERIVVCGLDSHAVGLRIAAGSLQRSVGRIDAPR